MENQHKFKIQLPFHGSQTVCESGFGAQVEMDGKQLEGVTDLNIKAGINGYTNVVIGFSSPAAVEMVAAMLPVVNADEDQLILWGHKFCQAYSENIDEINTEGGVDHAYIGGLLFKRTLELIMESTT